MTPAIYICRTYVEVRSASAGGRVLARWPYEGDAEKATVLAAARLVARDAEHADFLARCEARNAERRAARRAAREERERACQQAEAEAHFARTGKYVDDGGVS